MRKLGVLLAMGLAAYGGYQVAELRRADPGASGQTSDGLGDLMASFDGSRLAAAAESAEPEAAASLSPATSAYERYATAMANREFAEAAHHAAASAQQKALLHRRARRSRTSGSHDKVYLSHKALAELPPRPQPELVGIAGPVEYRFQYLEFHTNDAGTIVELEAVQSATIHGKPFRLRQHATIMELSGTWKVTEVYRPGPRAGASLR